MKDRFLSYLISLLLPTMFGFVSCGNRYHPQPVPEYGVMIPDSVREQLDKLKSEQDKVQNDSLNIISETTELQ